MITTVISLWRNIEGKRLEAAPLPKLDMTGCWALAAVDYDNDGWIDLAGVGTKGAKAQITLLRPRCASATETSGAGELRRAAILLRLSPWQKTMTT